MRKLATVLFLLVIASVLISCLPNSIDHWEHFCCTDTANPDTCKWVTHPCMAPYESDIGLRWCTENGCARHR